MNGIINRFYTAFANADWQTMAECYHEDAVFSDPVFPLIKGKEIAAMWQMLIERSKGNIDVAFSNVLEDELTGRADWVAEYFFSASERRVINRIHAEFEFCDGKIIRHTDSFNLHKWASQALGIKGKLFGGFVFFRKKLQKTARQGLDGFIARNFS